MPHKLKGLKIDRVDLVDVGANLDLATGEGSHIALAKRAPTEGTGEYSDAPTDADPDASGEGGGGVLRELWDKAAAAIRKGTPTFGGHQERRQLRRAVGEVQQGLMALASSLDAAVHDAEDDEDPQALVNRSLAEFDEWFSEGLEAWRAGEPMAKRAPEEDDPKEEPMTTPDNSDQTTDIDLDALPGDARKAFQALEKRAEEAEERAQALEAAAEGSDADAGDSEGGDGEAALKGANPEVLARIEKAEQRAERAEKRAEEERDRRLQREFLQKAGELQAVPGERGDVAKMLRAVHEAEDLPDDVKKQIPETLKSMQQTILSSGLLEARGHGGDGNAGSALAEINKRAQQLVDAGEADTRAQAIEKVADQDQDLYHRYKEEQGRA